MATRLFNCSIIFFILFYAGCLRYWHERNKVDYVISSSAVWNDDAVLGALESAVSLVKGLPFVRSLSGQWNFLLASSPANVPIDFYSNSFDDSVWETLQGRFFQLTHSIVML